MTCFFCKTSFVMQITHQKALLLKWLRVNKWLAMNVEDFHRTWNIEQVMKDFPIEMQGDIAMHLHREVLSLPIFENASQGCLKTIALMIKPMFCAPGEFIIHKGDVMSCIYFVCNGSLEILKDSMVVAILGWSFDALPLHSYDIQRSFIKWIVGKCRIKFIANEE